MMVNKVAELMGRDKKLKAIFGGIVSSGIILLSLIIITGVFT